MCGITGIISRNPSLVSEQKLRAALSCLSHRGPAASGAWINADHTVAFGHHRLSIIDLSAAAVQPMHYAGRYTIIHNGEIYNYKELRDTLRRQGYSFHSASDTEVLLAGYDAWGKDLPTHLDGMFAFIIWDEKEKNLFAARDRFGEKPLFFYYDEERLVLTSEIKSFWNLGISREVNTEMLYNFLTIGYTANPSDPQETFFRNIGKLPAASSLNYSLTSGELWIEKYWQIFSEAPANVSEKEAIESFEKLFSDSIQKRLRSDVAIGTSLSGGLDSSAVVAFCHQHTADHYSHKCFTVSFPGYEKDESAAAANVAAQFGLHHIVTHMNGESIVELMNKVMYHQEEPVGSASALAQYRLFKTAKEHGVTVLLDGQGADEILAGYHKYYKWYWQELFRKRKLGRSDELKAARDIGVTEEFGWRNKMASIFPELAASLLQSKKAKQAFHHPQLHQDFAFAHKRQSYYTTPASFDLNGVLYYNSFVNGLEELLRLADRNSMAHATEVRLPFLSHQLVEFLFSLPPDMKIRNGWTKWLLRQSLGLRLPSDIVWKKEKRGFEPPQKKWMQREDVKAAIIEGKRKLVREGILATTSAEKIKPHTAYAADCWDWKCWSASYLF